MAKTRAPVTRGRSSRWPRRSSARPRCGASYGDFSNGRLASWNAAVRSFAIVQHQQPAHVRGKNAADIALVDRRHGFDAPGAAGRILYSCRATATSPGSRKGSGRAGSRSTASASARRRRRSATACHRFVTLGKAPNGAVTVSQRELDTRGAGSDFRKRPERNRRRRECRRMRSTGRKTSARPGASASRIPSGKRSSARRSGPRHRRRPSSSARRILALARDPESAGSGPGSAVDGAADRADVPLHLVPGDRKTGRDAPRGAPGEGARQRWSRRPGRSRNRFAGKPPTGHNPRREEAHSGRPAVTRTCFAVSAASAPPYVDIAADVG